MTKKKNFIKGLGLSALLTFATSCSDSIDKNAPKTNSNVAMAILRQAQNQAKDFNFMNETDHIFSLNVNLIYRDDFVPARFIAYQRMDSAKYAKELIHDAKEFTNLSDFNKRLIDKNTNFVCINYYRYRRAVALLNAARKKTLQHHK